MKSILILGKGFIGSNLSNYFSEKNIEHEVYSRNMLDYTNPKTLNDFLEQKKETFYTVINTSGYTGRPNVDGCERNKKDCWDWNVIHPLNIAKTCNEHKLAVIQVSSGCIYSGYDKEYTEKDLPNFGMFSDDSSFYSKCKHAGEILLENNEAAVYILRIRIPFTHTMVPKNYFTKLLNYDNLIDMNNSVTSVADFNNFIFRFLYLIQDMPGGIYNVCNPQPVKASEVVSIMKKHGIENPKWNFIEVKDLNTVANRSNCVLSTDKLEQFNLSLPDTFSSIERDVKIFKGYVNA